MFPNKHILEKRVLVKPYPVNLEACCVIFPNVQVLQSADVGSCHEFLCMFVYLCDVLCIVCVSRGATSELSPPPQPENKHKQEFIGCWHMHTYVYV